MHSRSCIRFPARETARILLVTALAGTAPGMAVAQDNRPVNARTDETGAPVSVGLLPEPRIIARSIDFAIRIVHDGGEVKTGFYPELSNMPTGAGWISIGPGYRRWFFGDHALLDASAAVSWRTYKMAQVRFEVPRLARSRLAAGTQVRWQDLTQVTYFGDGPDSLEGDRSEYRMKTTNILGYAILRPTRDLSIGGRAGWLDSPTLSSPAGSFKRGNPYTGDVFPNDPVFALKAQPAYAYGETWVAADTRDHRSHPTRGGLYRAAWTTYSDRDSGSFSFDRSEAEAAQFLPLAGARVVIAVHGWLVATGTADGHIVPFYLEPSLGGHNTLRGYSDFRFHGRSLLLVNVEARVALFTHVDAAMFADAGNVAPRVADVNLDKRSYGIGLRVHSRESTFARLDVAHGDEGWRVLFRISDPLHLSRLSRRPAAIPFVP